MRVTFSFGGGPSRNRRNKSNYYRRGAPRTYVSIPLGPVGSMIVSVIIILAGIMTSIMSLGSIVPLIVGIVFIIYGMFIFGNSRKQLKYNRRKKINDEKEEE